MKNNGAPFGEAVAIVGFGGVFPACRTLEDFWGILERGMDTSRPVPGGRWVLDSRKIQSPAVNAPDRVHTDRGCFIEDFSLNPAGLNLSAEWLASLDPSIHLLLEAGRNALAGARTATLDRRRVGVILGNIALPTTAASALGEKILTPPLEQNALGQTAQAPALGATALNRYVSGLPAGVLAQALGLGGGTCTLDAACASSLYALKLACDELRAGRADAMLAGGLSRPDSLYTQMGFSQLRALSPTGRCAPFDAAGSGLIVGEGAGVLVLKRLSDAVRDGDKIHALIRGIGLSNDLDGNLLSPSSEGQLRALHQAYQQAGWTPDQVDLIECHATGTPVGDAVEFQSLTKLWQGTGWRPGQCVLGAVKANIGHLLTAAGSASLIKILLALQHNTLPATANFRQPAEKIPLADSPFSILQQSRPWRRREEGVPRRAAINGFGFGGINAHVLIEEWLEPSSLPPVPAGTPQVENPKPDHSPKTKSPATPPRSVPVAIVGLAANVGRWPTLQAFQERVLGGGRDELPAERNDWRGIQAEELRSRSGRRECFPGYYLDDLEIPLDRYRIPPKELAELLPQQALMLEVARAALADARLARTEPARTGVFIGLGLDLRTTDFHFRWVTLERHGAGGAPALTADRTMGALAGINASRIAKEFHFGGPSHTVCSEDCSGVRALEIAVRALQTGEVDQALAGAVDLTGDWRALLATDAVNPYSRVGTPRPFDAAADGSVPGEGSVALILKRLDEAQRDGDRIYAVIRGIGAASGGEIGGGGAAAESQRRALECAYQEAGIDPATVGFIEANGAAHLAEDRAEAQLLDAFFGSERRKFSARLGSAKADVGHTGAASGLVAVAKASLALYQEILPALRGVQQPIPAVADSKTLSAPMLPQYWVRNRADGPRRAGVSAASIDGNFMHVVLEAGEEQASERRTQERRRPLGAPKEALFVFQAEDRAGLGMQLETLRVLTAAAAGRPVESLARQWWRSSSANGKAYSLALVAQNSAQLLRLLATAATMIASPSKGTERSSVSRKAALRESASVGAHLDRERIFFVPPEQQVRGGMAFVFPGAGNSFSEMGRELALAWPEILRAQDRENQFLASQMFTNCFWNTTATGQSATDHRAQICGQVALGTFVSDLAVSFGIKPETVVGYSLGESTGLFALRAWTDRDEMLRRVSISTLFTQDLTGTPEKLRQAWRVPDGEPATWQAGLVDRPEDVVRTAIAGRPRLYVLVVNTPGECVIGGDATAVKALIKTLHCHWFPLTGVSTVHCELLRPVEKAYRDLHRFETTAPAGVKFFSGGSGRAYAPDRETAADAIVAQARDCIDFPRMVRAAYDSGIRFFLEMGPGNSCSRMIAAILEGRSHVALSLCGSAQEPVLNVLRGLGRLVAEGVPVDLKMLYGGAFPADAEQADGVKAKTLSVCISIAGPPFSPPPATTSRTSALPLRPILAEAGGDAPGRAPSPARPEAADPFEMEFSRAMAETQAATVEAHAAYLNFSQGVFDTLSKTVASQFSLISALGGAERDATGRVAGNPRNSPLRSSLLPPPTEDWDKTDSATTVVEPKDDRASRPPKIALDRAACLEFARGSVGKVLGAAFAPADAFPTRVRLPDEPLMLVDRILEIHGDARSMTQGRVVTEHDILAGAWYLDGGCIPTCIAVEAGQADLFLSGYLGIDFQTEGRAVYRLLDAKIRFHRGLPGPGEVIHYDIRIDHFFRQGDTWLFRFNFEATVAGEPLLTMTDGCAGFFSAAELAGGRGIVHTSLDLKPMPCRRAADWEEIVSMAVESYSAEQLDALRAGDFARCFGPQFAKLALRQPVTLPSGRMKLVHRISHLDPGGGRFGLGLIRGEADIHPDDWFLTCHFVDDRVMPGTLMFECCLHTLRVFLLRLGWVAEQDQVHLEPVPDVLSQLKCRGQVLETTAVVTYEISIKELGYRPEPYVIADALMLADGKPIVEITNMSLRYAGATREMIRQSWAASPATAQRLMTDQGQPSAPAALYDHDRILAFAIGKPSVAFGEPYQIFDERRRIARLPGPPYQFLDRITAVEGEPFKMVPGGVAVAEYDIPANAWYFAANRQSDMPFAVLLEIALQPCGWLAAYVGSALTSETDLSFRNLGGNGRQFASVHPQTGTLTTRVKMTRVSSSAGMIIQWFDFEVRAGTSLIYQGDTYFGFFPKAALAKQEGIQNAKLYQPGEGELNRRQALAYPTAPPFADEQLRMVDQIESFIPDGGPHQLGFIRATKQVRPEEWFFQAHFYQDPVVPGSLGLESFLQLLKFLAIQRWGQAEGMRWEAVALDTPHEWIYRGQIIPRDHLVTVEAVVTAINEEERLLTADGFLSVDGRVIYGMKKFTVRQRRIPSEAHPKPS